VVKVNILQRSEGIYKWKTAVVSHQHTELSFKLTYRYEPWQLPSGSPIPGEMNSASSQTNPCCQSQLYQRNLTWNVKRCAAQEKFGKTP